MADVPAKVLDRFKENLAKFQKILEQAIVKDVNLAVEIKKEIIIQRGKRQYLKITK